MLKPRKKLTKKELKSDPLLEALDEGKEFYEKHKNTIFATVGGVLAVLLISWVYMNNKTSTENKAMLETAKVISAYTANPTDEVVSELEMVVAEYGDVSGAELARFYLGVAKLDAKEYDVAKEIFEDLSRSVLDKTIKLAAISKLGETYSLLNDNKLAAKSYLDAAKIASGDVSDALKISAALAFYDAKDAQSSKNILDDLLNKKMSKENRANTEYLLGKISQ